MSKVKDTSYFTIQGWMLNQLRLKGNQLHVFAIIHGFSHSEENEYKGSLQYLCEFTGASRSTVMRSLSELQELGFINKREVYENGVKFNRYKSSVDMCVYFDTPSVKMTPPPCQNDTTPRVKMTPHNIDDNIDDNKEDKIGITRSASAPLDFDRFWKAYPLKKAKQAALKAWKKINPDKQLAETIISAVEKQKRWEDWIRDNGQYIPHPATWLNQGRWEDEERRKAKPDDGPEQTVDGDAIRRRIEAMRAGQVV